MNENNNIIEIKDVWKTFGSKDGAVTALKEVAFKVREGEFISILGPSGCGKTTLLRIIGGLEKATKGEIIIKKNPNSNSNNGDTGFVFQDPTLLPWRNVINNTVLAPEIKKQDFANYYEKAEDILKLVGLEGFEEFYPNELSGGMKQRVAIARALIHDPLILLMDEPFGALDEITRKKMNFELLEIWKKTKKTIIFVTHSVDEAVLLSNRIVVMSSRPGTVEDIIDINLPDNRDMSIFGTKEFSHYTAMVRKALSKSMSLDSKSNEFAREGTLQKINIKEKLKTYLLYAIVFIAFIGLWKSIVFAFNIPTFLIPSPEEVFSEYLRLLSNGLLLKHTFVTLKEALLGFLFGSLLGIGIGYPLAKSKKVEQILSPYVVAAQTAPKIALAPLIVIWFGFGISSKVFLAMLIVFFPILINTMLGIRSVDDNQIELFKSTNASKLQMFTKLELPSALPVIFAGFKTSITLAVIGAVVGEFVGANAGLGYMTIYASGLMDTPQVFVAILQLTLLGIVLYGIITLIGSKLMPWHKAEE